MLLKKILNIKSGSSKPNKEKIGKINKLQIIKIAEMKSVDMTGRTLESMSRSIIGTANSMGIIVKD